MEPEKEGTALQGTYTFGDCCKVLSVDFKTFKKWLLNEEVKAHDSAYDTRVKYLTSEQVKALAARHGRPWPPSGQQEPEQITAQMAKRILEQLAITSQQAQEVHTEQATLHTTLEALQQGLTAMQAEQAAFVERSAQQHTEALERWKQSRAALETLATDWEAERVVTLQRFVQVMDSSKQQDGRIEATAARLDALEKAQRQIRTELTTLTTGQQKTAATLDTLVATSEEREKQTRAALDTLTTGQQQITATLGALETTSTEQQQRQTRQAAQLATIRQELTALQDQQELAAQQMQQAQASMQEELQQAQKGLKAEFGAALQVARQELQAEQEHKMRELSTAILQQVTEQLKKEQTERLKDFRDLQQVNKSLDTQTTRLQRTFDEVSDDLSDELHELKQRLDALDKRFPAAEQQPAAASPDSTEPPKHRRPGKA